MKTRLLLLLLVCALCFALGTANMIPLATGDELAAGKDQLIGVLVTMEHLDLFDTEQYIQDNIGLLLSGGGEITGDTAAYQGRIYAQLLETPSPSGRVSREYIFPGISGYRLIAPQFEDEEGVYTATCVDSGISDVHLAVINGSIQLEGTIYASTTGNARTFSYNPVYQEPSGAVYVVSGHGSSHSGDLVAGSSSTYSYYEEESATRSGETTSNRSSVKLTTTYIDPPEKTVLFQLDENCTILSREVYAPGALPETLTPVEGAAFLLVESASTDQNGQPVTLRQLFAPADGRLHSFYQLENGICAQQFCQILWEN